MVSLRIGARRDCASSFSNTLQSSSSVRPNCSRADFPIVIHSDYIPRIQEVQASVYDVIREMLEVYSRGQG